MSEVTTHTAACDAQCPMIAATHVAQFHGFAASYPGAVPPVVVAQGAPTVMLLPRK